MHVKITGLLNYTKTPIEESWEKAAEYFGLDIGNPDPIDTIEHFDSSPIINREVEKVQEDALNEYISVKTAKNIYGVIIDPETFDVDYDATQKLRARKKRAQRAKKAKQVK